MKLNELPSELEDTLYSFAVAAQAPSAAALDEMIRQYPQYAEELTDIVIDLALEAISSNEDDDDSAVLDDKTSSAISRAMSHFNNRLYELGAAKNKSSVSVENPFAALDRAGMQSLASGLNANKLFIIKIRDHDIDPETMSDGFKNELANKLKVPFECIAAYVAMPQQLTMKVHYKADQKPIIAQRQTFEDAVKTSQLTAEQQAYLLSL